MDVSNFTVLIVDDEPTTRKILMHFLQKAGYASMDIFLLVPAIPKNQNSSDFPHLQKLNLPREVLRPCK